MLDLKALTDYGNWIGETAWEVHWSVMRVGGWQQVFPGALPRWASRIRQYFNLTPMTLELLDHEESSRYLERVQTALPSARAEAIRNALRWQPGGEIGTIKALSGAVYEDALARISHRIKRIGAPNQRKLFCENDFLMIRGEPRCRQSVSRICLDLKPLKAAK
jgi:hypothetical protein